MGRPRRLQFPGACYHIVLSGNNRQDLFLSNQDRRHFLNLLRQYKERYDLKIYAYSLLDNSVELLLETKRPNLSLVMQSFNTVYTKYFNSARGTSGHVFQGRYKALVVEKETALLEMTVYVHLNSVRSGLKERPWRYQWSSAGAYVEAGHREPLVDSDEVLRKMGKSRFSQSLKYLKLLKERLKSQSQWVLPIIRGFCVGTEAYASRLEALPEPLAGDGGSQSAARKIVAETAQRHGMDAEKLLGRSQWRDVAAARREAMYRIWKEARLGVTEVARLFGRTPSAVSQAIRALEK